MRAVRCVVGREGQCVQNRIQFISGLAHELVRVY
jgi:hypothetical protein